MNAKAKPNRTHKYWKTREWLEMHNHHPQDQTPHMLLQIQNTALRITLDQWLQDHASEQTSRFNTESPMQLASKDGHLAICKWLLSIGEPACINTLTQYGESPISVACQHGHLETCQWLLDNGPTVAMLNQKYDLFPAQGWCLMHIACANGHCNICQWLIEIVGDTNISTTDDYGRTPMSLACGNGHYQICKCLYNGGAQLDIHCPDSNHHYPLLHASQQGHIQVCVWLIAHGALNEMSKNQNPQSSQQQSFELSPDIFSPDIAKRDVHYVARPRVIQRAQKIITDALVFKTTLLRAPVSQHKRPNSTLPQCHLWALPRDAIQNIAEFLDIHTERKLRNIRIYVAHMAHASAKDQAKSIWSPNLKMKISYVIRWKQIQSAAETSIKQSSMIFKNEHQAARFKTALNTSIDPKTCFSSRKIIQCESEAIFLTSRQACRIMGWHEPPRNAPQELWWKQDGHQRAELFSDETELRKYMRAIRTSPATVRQISVIERNHHVQELKQRAGLHLLNKLKWHQIPRTVIASIIAYNSDKANEKQTDTPKEEACEM